MTTFATRPCMVCNKHSFIELTDEEMDALNSGAMVQDALPNRDPDFREMVLSGTHPTCWDEAFGGFDCD